MSFGDTPVERARHTDRWTEIIFRAVTARVANRWRFVSFRGAAGGEWRGIVDVLAIRKSTSVPDRADLKRGDLFDMVIIQMKGGSAKRPSAAERARLAAVRDAYRATAVVLFEWSRGKVTRFSVLDEDLNWRPVACRDIFGA